MNGPYFGNGKTLVVHDLNKAKSECKIGEVDTINKKYFDPDTLDQALKECFTKCNFCL